MKHKFASSFAPQIFMPFGQVKLMGIAWYCHVLPTGVQAMFTTTHPPTHCMASRVTCLIELIVVLTLGLLKIVWDRPVFELEKSDLQATSRVSPEISFRHHRSIGALECSKSPLLNGH